MPYAPSDYQPYLETFEADEPEFGLTPAKRQEIANEFAKRGVKPSFVTIRLELSGKSTTDGNDTNTSPNPDEKERLPDAIANPSPGIPDARKIPPHIRAQMTPSELLAFRYGQGLPKRLTQKTRKITNPSADLAADNAKRHEKWLKDRDPK